MNRKSAFLEPEINQYGSHMVMSNVTRHSKFKFINIDTKYRDNIESSSTYVTPPYYNITLPERVNDVKSLMVCNAEIPMSFYNFSSSLGNNYFKIVTGSTIAGTSPIVIKIPNGEYTTATLKTAINSAISLTSYNGKITVDILDPPKFTTITANSGGAYTIIFDVDANGNADAYNFKQKLGWILGFRQRHYTVTSPNIITSENMVDVNTVRYLYLALEEFTKGTQNTFISPMNKSFLRSKTILAKISLNKKTFSFGDILPANNFNGYLLSDRRQYSGKVDLQKLNVQLIDENGNPVELNGMDFSFCIEVEHE
jgi:hypothetical protein